MKYQKVRKIISLISSFNLLLQSFLPLALVAPVYAEDATPPAVIELTPTPEATPTVEPTPEVTPEPTAEPTLTPTPEVTPTPELTPTVELTPTPEATPTVEPTPEVTPEPTPVEILPLPENLSNVSALEQGTPEPAPSISTDKSDYFPTDTVYLTGTAFKPNTAYFFHIYSTDTPPFSTTPEVTSDENGGISLSFRLDGNYRPHYTIDVTSASGDPVLSYSFLDSRNFVSVTVNGGASATVSPSSSFSVSVELNTNGTGEGNDWESTGYTIEGQSPICDNSPDYTHVTDGATDDRTLTAPTATGDYDLTVTAHSGNNCSGQSDSTTLTDAIKVSVSTPTQPDLPNNPLDDYALTSVSGVWTSVSGGSNVTGINTEEVRWGNTQGQKSGLRFDGSTVQTFNSGDTFYLGALTHFNYPIQNPSSGAKLKITLQFSQPTVSPNPSFSYDFVIDETTNSWPCLSGWQTSLTPCDDRVRFPNSYGSASFEIDDKLYTLQISGFVNSFPGGSPISQFVTQEEKNNTAYLVGTLSSVLVAAPQITLVEKAVEGDDADSAPGQDLYVGDTAHFTYNIQNTGNVDMTNVSVIDNMGVTVTCPQTTLSSGSSMVCTGETTVVAGQYTNTAYVRGTYNGTVYQSNNETANYFGVVRNVCGDGNQSATEACDDGEENGNICTPSYDATCTYCSVSCTEETVVGPRCGDGAINGDEACDGADLGGLSSNDFTCSAACSLELIEDKITICHATSSHSNPYNTQTPDKSADVSGHDGHNGEVWYPGITTAWGDIIPPFSYIGGTYTGKNWTAEGQAIFNNDCHIPAYCGNGITDSNEECDDANSVNTDACTNDCLLPVCGDGYVQSGELCDDSNTVNGDGCSSSCQIEKGSVTACKYNDANRNGLKDDNETNIDWSFQIDGGDFQNTIDGCHTFTDLDLVTHTITENSDSGWASYNPASVDVPLTNSYQTETVYFGNYQLNICGDGYLDSEEICDDGNRLDTDACTNSCTLPVCGDGIVSFSEVCDEGVANDSTCTPEYGSSCTYCDQITCDYQTVDGPYCGDGIKDDIEECDGSSGTPSDYTCSGDCVLVRDTGTLTINKQIVPSADSGKFNLLIGDVVHKADAGDGDSTGAISLSTGSYSVSEVAGTDTDLSDYRSVLDCLDESGASVIDGPRKDMTLLPSLEVAKDQNIVCTFVNTKLANLTAHQFTDNDANGVEDGSDGVTTSGWRMNLFSGSDCSGDPLQSLLTEYPSGNVLFGHLLPGDYSVGEEPYNAAWSNSTPVCQNITLEAGDSGQLNFGNYMLGTITITKDAKPNSGQDFTFRNNFGNDNPSVFKLDDDSNITLPKTRSFSVFPGTYTVSEDIVAGWKLSSAVCSDGSSLDSITVSPGENITCTVTNKKLGSITLVKNTNSGDGTFEFTMTGASLPASATLTTWGSTASQTFTAIDPENKYTISEIVPEGWSLESAVCVNRSGVQMKPSKISVSNGGSVTCTFSNLRDTGSLLVNKVIDADGDLSTTHDQTPGANWQFDVDGLSLGSTDAPAQYTTSTGSALFSGLNTGTYTIIETKQSGYDLIGASCNTEDGIFDKTDSLDGVIVSKDETATCTFYNSPNSTIHGYKWNDLNGNSQKDGAEALLSGWTINLYRWNGEGFDTVPSATTTTSSLENRFGWYWFEKLLPGRYQVCEVSQTGWTQTYPLNTDNNNCHTVSLPESSSGDLFTDSATGNLFNFGNLQLGEINVTKYDDLDSDGVQDENEKSLGGWTISLSDNQNKVTGEDGRVSYGELTPNRSYTLGEEMQEGWVQTNISCSVSNLGDGVEITAPNEAYGHHGVCGGWNNCGDAATCALWACQAEGYSNLVSYGESRPCTEFGNCNLFYNGPYNGVQYDWGNWCPVMGVTDIVCSNSTGGSSSSQNRQVLFEEESAPGTKNINLKPGDVVECAIGNHQVEPKLYISRSNNAVSGLVPGSSFEHTIVIRVLENNVSNLKLTDLLPEGFKFGGSYTVSSQKKGSITLASNPEYHSPGVWQLGDYEKDDVITIKYLAEVDASTLPGVYDDLAYATANDAYGKGLQFLAQGELSEFVAESYVGTDVEIVKEQTKTETYQVEKEEVKEGQVLGASTTLPATGASPAWLILALVSFVCGTRLIRSAKKSK